MDKRKLPIWAYYILSFTWGGLISLAGAVAALCLLALGKKPRRNQYGWYFTAGRNWGGVNLGWITITDQIPTRSVLNHEFGHSIQNCFFGPFMIFIALASVIRYWYRAYLITVKLIPRSKLPAYDSIWFEGQASHIGDFYKGDS